MFGFQSFKFVFENLHILFSSNQCGKQIDLILEFKAFFHHLSNELFFTSFCHQLCILSNTLLDVLSNFNELKRSMYSCRICDFFFTRTEVWRIAHRKCKPKENIGTLVVKIEIIPFFILDDPFKYSCILRFPQFNNVLKTILFQDLSCIL